MSTSKVINFKEFSDRFLELNKDATKTEIKKQYLVEKKRAVKAASQKISIIAVPSVTQVTVQDFVQTQDQQSPEQEQDLYQQSPEQEQEQEQFQEQIDSEELLETNKQSMIVELLSNLNDGLYRVINELPAPKYPQNPYTKELLNPLDIYRIKSKLRIDEDASDLQVPMLITLIAHPRVLLPAFEAAKQGGDDSSILLNLMKTSGFVFSEGMWLEKSVPRIRDEFIEHQLDVLSGKFSKKINFNDLFELFIGGVLFQEHILDNVFSTKDLLRIIAINPEMFDDENDLKYLMSVVPLFGLKREQIEEILTTENMILRKKMVLDILEPPKELDETPAEPKRNKRSLFRMLLR